MKKTTPAQGIGTGATIIVLWDKAKDGIDYMAGIDWNIAQIDWVLAMPWLQEIATLVVVVMGGIWAFDKTRNSVGPAPQRRATTEAGDTRPIQTQPPERLDYFPDSETDCKGQDCPDDCRHPGIDAATKAIANDLRREYGVLHVNSGYRCETHNQRVGGSDTSYHRYGRALDIRPGRIGVTPKMLYEYLCRKYPGQHEIGLYKTFVHFAANVHTPKRKHGANQKWVKL